MGAPIGVINDLAADRFEVPSGRSYRTRGTPGIQPEVARGLIIVSNRLPFAATQQGGECWLQPTGGGLATALRRIHEKGNSFWIGSVAGDGPEATDPRLRDRFASTRLAGISLSSCEIAGYYRRYANGVLWPALHAMAFRSTADRHGWTTYQSVNVRFADHVAAHWRPGDRIWVHDYHLMLLPGLLRARLPEAPIGFFLHTPCPGRELAKLTEWPQLADGIMGANVIGLQTQRDVEAFADIAGCTVSAGRAERLASDGRPVRVIAAPIAIDHAWFAERSRQAPVLSQRASLKAERPGPLFLGVDRLDYTKGIPERLLAFQRLLDFEPALRGRARFVQVAVPSREGVEGYAELRNDIEQIVVDINDNYGTDTWTPVDYRCGSVDANTLVALYAAADVMVVTPKRDGMNLVAKEFVASRTDGGGALVLSRTAGAAAELRAALMVDPDDVASIMAGYRRALRMPVTERRSRMRKLREVVRSRDVFDWARHFVEAVGCEPVTTSCGD